MFMDENRREIWNRLRKNDLRFFRPFLQAQILRQAADEVKLHRSRGPLSHEVLVWLAIRSALQPACGFDRILSSSLKLIQHLHPDRLLPPHEKEFSTPLARQHPRPPGKTDISEEAFVQARHKLIPEFWQALIARLSAHFQREHPAAIRWKQFRLLAMDGTTIKLSGQKKLIEHFGTLRNSNQGHQAQARLVLLQLPLVRLPVAYQLSPVKQGERPLGERLLKHLQHLDLLLIDRGFWSYGLFHLIASRKAFFAIRLHSQAKFHRVKQLGKDDHLVRFDKPTGPRWRRKEWPESQLLRVVYYQMKGFKRTAIVTNVLDPESISREEWIALAKQKDLSYRRIDQGLYHRRWEIETTFHELKVVQGLERHLRSRTPAGIEYEVAGHLILYLLVRWLMVNAAAERSCELSEPLDPLCLSFKHSLEILLEYRSCLLQATSREQTTIWLPLIITEILEHQTPYRPHRSYPRHRPRKPN